MPAISPNTYNREEHRLSTAVSLRPENNVHIEMLLVADVCEQLGEIEGV